MQLSVENLSVSYGNIKALHGISFEVDEEREIVCIIGANGAGKSTTLRAISGLVPSHPGSKMTFQGQDLTRYPADKIVTHLGISHVPEGRRLTPKNRILPPSSAGVSTWSDTVTSPGFSTGIPKPPR